MQEFLDCLLLAALAQPLCTSADVWEEAHENLFYLEITEPELALCTASALIAWLEAVLAGKRQQLQQQAGSSYLMQFYCWHDAQATQLRFSLVSAVAALPFRCSLRLVELPIVLQEFLAQEYLLFDKNLFEANPADTWPAVDQAPAGEFVLPVWRVIIP